MLPNFFKRAFVRQAGTLLVASLALSACGGGGGDPGEPILGTAPVATVKLDLINGAGAAITSISSTQGGVVRAVVRNKAGEPVSNALVQFTAPGLSMTPATGAVATDASGVAALGVIASPGTTLGAVDVAAGVEVDKIVVLGKVAVTVVAP